MAEPTHDDDCRCMACCAEKFKTIDPARAGKAPKVGTLAACPYCEGLIRAYHGHISGRCSAFDDINALLAEIRAAARAA